MTIREAINLFQNKDSKDKSFRALLSDEVPGGINPYLLDGYWTGYVKPLIEDMKNINPESYRIKNIQKFKFNGKTFQIPEPLVINDALIPGYLESADVYVEANDLLRGIADGGWELLPALVATYCRQKDEPFTEKLQLKRAEEFKGLTMDVAWEVFFSALKSSNTLAKDLVLRVQQQINELRSPRGLRGLIRWVTRRFSIGWPKAEFAAR